MSKQEFELFTETLMDEESQYDKTVRRAARKFKSKRDKNKATATILDILKNSRKAAGLPLNPVATDLLRPDDGDNIKPPSKAPSIMNESPLQEAALCQPDGNERDHVQDEPYFEKDYVTVEPDWNVQHKNEGSWQDDKSLIQCNLYMLEQEIGCDVTCLVGENQEAIQAHSYVLSLRSVKFADILADEKHLDIKVIDIPDVKTDTFRLLLRYLYSDDIEPSVDQATALIPAASVYGPMSLKTSCFHFLLSEMNSDNVCVTLELAHTFNERSAYDRCVKFIFVNAVDVLKSPNFGKLCRDCVEDIVKSDDLNAKEFVVFEALTIWANRICLQKRLQPTDENKRKVLDKLLFHVRFATMDVLEFTQKISYSEVLVEEEKISLYQFFHGETHKLPLRFNKGNRHTYVVNHDLVNRTLGKRERKQYIPDILPQTVVPAIPYKHSEECVDSLPMKRAIRFQGIDKNWQIRGPDAIAFRVSIPIFIRGVQMFGPSSGQDSYNVDIVVYNCHGDIECHDEKKIVTGKSLKVYDVVLTSSVRVPAGRTFTVQLTIRGKPTYCGINGLEFVEKDGVNFQFFNSNKSLNGTDTSIGQIATILFSKVENQVPRW